MPLHPEIISFQQTPSHTSKKEKWLFMKFQILWQAIWDFLQIAHWLGGSSHSYFMVEYVAAFSYWLIALTFWALWPWLTALDISTALSKEASTSRAGFWNRVFAGYSIFFGSRMKFELLSAYLGIRPNMFPMSVHEIEGWCFLRMCFLSEDCMWNCQGWYQKRI